MNLRRLWVISLILAMLLAPVAPAAAQEEPDDPNDPNPLDNSFSQHGILDPEGQVNPEGLAVQPDGKIILVGSIQNDGASDVMTLRYLHNGRLDRSFDDNGIVATGFGPGDEWGVVPLVQPDGHILSIGWGIWSGAYGLALARLLPDGAPDESFNGTGKLWIGVPVGADFHVGAALLQPDGKIVIAGGYIAEEDGHRYLTRLLVRYNADGTPDAGFGAAGVVNHRFIESPPTMTLKVYDVAVGRDGSIITVGAVRNGNHSWWMVDVYNSDGSYRQFIPQPQQETACAQAGCLDNAGGVEVQPDGKIVIAGSLTTLSGLFNQIKTQTFYVMRFHPNWSLDASFDGDGQAATVITPRTFGGVRDQAFDLTLQPDGRIVVVGASAGDFALARYNPNGSLDNSFNDNGIIKTDLDDEDTAWTVRLQPDGKFLALGTRQGRNSNNTQSVLARYRKQSSGSDPGPIPDFPHRLVLPMVVR
jgi:uncharacterized delta-60 repeat protein